MPGRKGGMVYHWKHGFIPLDHYAALQKAHGSQIGAARIMQRHGIADGPKSLHSVDRSNGGKGKPDAPAAKPAAHAKVRDLPAGDTFKGVHSETHKGEKLSVRKGKQWGQLEVQINGHTAGVVHGTKNSDAVKQLDSLRGTVDHAKANPSGYINGNGDASYGMKLDKPAASGIEARRAETQRIQAEHLRAGAVAHGITKPQPSAGDLTDAAAIWKRQNPGKTIAGHDREVTRLAERLAEDKFIRKNQQGDTEAQKAANRERIKRDAQVGSSALLGKMLAEKQGTPAGSVHAARAEELRAAAAKKRAEADRIAGSVGAPDRAGAMLRAKDSQRMNARMDSGLRRFSEKQREAKALESKAHLAEGRAKTAAEKQAAADLGVTAAKLSPGDMVQHKGSVHMVTKVNRTTVSVPSIVGGSWEDKLSIGQVSKHVKVADMKESTLRTLMSRAKGNAGLQAVYMAELKRRGLSL